MACPLLEKLAPETRNLIYEYVLTFDIPLKHVRKMQPFINKLYQRSDSETETSSSAGLNDVANDMADILQLVDTALLRTSRLIFKEAIVTFYENNTIYLDADHCEAARIVSPQATDLSLARQVMMKISGWDDDTKSLSAFRNGIQFTLKGFPAIFPKLRTATLHISTDSSEEPVQTLFVFADFLHRSPNHEDVVFDGVGSVTARSVSQTRINYLVQYKKMIGRWANPGLEFSWPPPPDMLTRSMYPYSQDGHVHPVAIEVFNAACHSYLPGSHPEVADDSFEFWTIVDEDWRQTKLRRVHMPGTQSIVGNLHSLSVQITTTMTQLNDGSTVKSSGSVSGGQDDASDSIEQQPEFELDSAEDGADYQTSHKKT